MIWLARVLCVYGALALAGCATYTSQTEKMRADWAAGNAASASREAEDFAKSSADSGDALVWFLEAGAAARADGKLKESIGHFDAAFKLVERYESEAEIRLGQETAAIFTNQSFIPYKGYNYDKIMMSVYQALNHIEAKEFDAAAVDLKRLENFQASAERKNAGDIENRMRALDEESAKRGAVGASSYLYNPGVNSALRRAYGDKFPQSARQQAKGVYVNPYAYWVGGLYFANRPEDISDKNRAADLFRFAAQMLGGKSGPLNEDARAAGMLASGLITKFPATTYVVYEAGCAPVRKQIRVDIPLSIVGRGLPYVGVNFPYLDFQNFHRGDLSVMAGGKKYAFDTVADMDEIIKREFDSEFPYVVAKTIISAGVKAAAEYAASQAAGDYWWIAAIVGGIYQAATNDADLRTWTTLPKKIRIARLPTPKDGKLSIDGKAVELVPGCTNVVLVKRMSAGGKLIIRRFDFNDKIATKDKI